MRLDVLEHGHKRPARIFQRVVALVLRDELDDVAKTAMHRPEFFGRWFFDYGSEVLRGQSFWTAGEREYLAMFTSRLNECTFCARVHTETTRLESRGEVDVDDPEVMRPELAAQSASPELTAVVASQRTARLSGGLWLGAVTVP